MGSILLLRFHRRLRRRHCLGLEVVAVCKCACKCGRMVCGGPIGPLAIGCRRSREGRGAPGAPNVGCIVALAIGWVPQRPRPRRRRRRQATQRLA